MNAQIWALLWPDFWNQVYPNILASLIWAVPGFLGQHFAMRRHHRRVMAEHVEALRRAQEHAAGKQIVALSDGVTEAVREAVDAAHDRLVKAVTDANAAAAKRPRRIGW